MAKFEKGQIANPKGRPKGAISKDKAKFIESLQELLDNYAGDMKIWLEQIDDPEKRFQILKDFAEFIYPKLSRSENKTEISGDITLLSIAQELNGRSAGLPAAQDQSE